MHDRPRSWRRCSACSSASASPRRIGLVVPDPVAEGLAGAVRAGAGARAGSRSAGPLAGEEVGAVPDRGRAGQLRAAAAAAADGRSSSSRSRGADIVEEYESALRRGRRARRHRRPGDVQRRSTRRWRAPDARRRGGLAARARRGRLRVDRDRARRAPDLLPQPRAEGEGTLADLVHQTAMYYEDRLQGGGFARVVLSGAAAAMRAADADVDGAAPQPRGAAGRSRSNVDPRSAAALTDRITASPALLDTLAPLVGLLLGGEAARHDPHQPLDASVLQRARGLAVAPACSSPSSSPRTVFNATRVLRYSHSDTELGTSASQDEARAAELRGGRVEARAIGGRQADRARVARGAPGKRPHRPPHVLVDRAVQHLREDAARRRAHHGRSAEARSRRSSASTISVVARGVDDINAFMNNLETTGAFARIGSTLEEHVTEHGADRRRSIETLYKPSVGHAAGRGAAPTAGARR